MVEYPFFPESELNACSPPCSTEDMDTTFMDTLVELRLAFGKPMPLICAYRSPQHDRRKGRSGNSAHTEGRAVDIHMSDIEALELMCLARMMGFKGFGAQQAGPRSTRFVHLDTAAPVPGRKRPHFWGY